MWFTNFGNNSIGRITTAGVVTNYTGPGINEPDEDHGRIRTGHCGSPTCNNSIGRITTAGVVTNYTGTGINDPQGITDGSRRRAVVHQLCRQLASGGSPAPAPGTVSGFGMGLAQNGITVGPDGALWFTTTGSGNDTIGRITTHGTVTDFTKSGISDPYGITSGPDGNLWFANDGNNSIGQITTSGTVTDYSNAGISDPQWITVGSDGNLWFTNLSGGTSGHGSIGVITTGGAVTIYNDSSICDPEGITAGADGALWFANGCGGTYSAGSIGRITTGGTVTSYSSIQISAAYGITAGPDGNLWFTSSNGIGKITTSGMFTNYSSTAVSPQAITAGPDGALWVADETSIDRITTSGGFTTYTGTGVSLPSAITTGPDGALWFADAASTSVGRVTAGGTATVSNVAFAGTSADPQVVVSGSGFGSSPPSPTYAPGCGGTGLDYGYYLHLQDLSAQWDAGLETGSGATDCVALVISSWSNTRIVFGFGDGYNACCGWVLNRGDTYALNLFATVALGTVGYVPLVSSVQSLKSAKQPMLVINGSGFGPSPPVPAYPPNTGCGISNLTGSLYGSSFSFQDTTSAWTVGLGGVPAGTGNCVGLVVHSWSDSQILFGFGNVYHSNGWILKPNDSYSLSLYTTTSTGTASYTPAEVSLTPNSGVPKQAVTASGGGFAAGETVTVAYATALSSPKSVRICTATAAVTGTYACNGRIPTASKAGATGMHIVSATGGLSKIKVTTIFTLT